MAHELELAAVAAVDGLAGPAKARPGAGPKHAALHAECLNCGAKLNGRYCQDCGQVADDHHRSILHLAWEAVEGMFHLDGRLARTAPLLFFRPGTLARDHFEGRRQRHVPPFRLFLVTLLLFMLALEGLVHGGGHGAGGEHAAPSAAPRLGQTVTVREQDGTTRTATVPTAEQISRWTGGRVAPEVIARAARDEAGQAPAAAHPPAAPAPKGPSVKIGGGLITVSGGSDPSRSPARSSARQAGRELGAALRGESPPVAVKGVGEAVDAFDASSDKHSKIGAWMIQRVRKATANKEYFTAVVFGWAHRLAVLLLPITAGFLTLLYCYKRRFFVYDHLVVSMHFLSFLFIIWGVAYLTPRFARDWVVLAAFVWTPVNLFQTLRGAYGSGVIGAGVKTLVLWSATVVSFVVLIVGLLLIALGQM